MESSSTGGAPASFVQQMLRNNMMLLTVSLAVGAMIYFGVGLYMLIMH